MGTIPSFQALELPAQSITVHDTTILGNPVLTPQLTQYGRCTFILRLNKSSGDLKFRLDPTNKFVFSDAFTASLTELRTGTTGTFAIIPSAANNPEYTFSLRGTVVSISGSSVVIRDLVVCSASWNFYTNVGNTSMLAAPGYQGTGVSSEFHITSIVLKNNGTAPIPASYTLKFPLYQPMNFGTQLWVDTSNRPVLTSVTIST